MSKKVTHGELCDQALKHYLEISNEAMHSNSVVETAIKFYKKYGEREIPGEKDNKHCPKCKHRLRVKPQKNWCGGWLQYFKCSHCGQPLALTRQLINHRYRRILYIDDVEHMGLMTSGPGGY